MASRNSTTPMTQLSSRGLRKAPVKNTLRRWIAIAATKNSAAMWWIWRISSPPRTSKEMSRVEAMASLIFTPFRGA